jgi:hypothetical protein
MNIHNSCMSATPKVRMHLGVIGLHPLYSPPFMRMCFTPKHNFGLMGPCTSHFVVNPMLGLWHRSQVQKNLFRSFLKLPSLEFESLTKARGKFSYLSWIRILETYRTSKLCKNSKQTYIKEKTWKEKDESWKHTPSYCCVCVSPHLLQEQKHKKYM